jgi:hypothetical protein
VFSVRESGELNRSFDVRMWRLQHELLQMVDKVLISCLPPTTRPVEMDGHDVFGPGVVLGGRRILNNEFHIRLWKKRGPRARLGKGASCPSESRLKARSLDNRLANVNAAIRVHESLAKGNNATDWDKAPQGFAYEVRTSL